MNNEILENTSEQAMLRQTSRKEKNKPESKNWTVFVFIILWIGLVGGGFYAAKYYLDQSVRAVQQTNALQVQVLNERVDTLNKEILSLKKILGSTDESLSSSSSILAQMNLKIETMANQMAELEASLKILKEAPNARD